MTYPNVSESDIIYIMPYTIPDAFRTWLNRMLDEHHMSQAEASRRAGLNQNAISNLMTGRIKGVTLNTAIALSQLFGTSPVEILKMAGRLESSPSDDELGWAELIWLARKLNPEAREELLRYLRWRAATQQ